MLKSDFSKCSVKIDEVVLGLSITEVNKKSCFLLQKCDCEVQKQTRCSALCSEGPLSGRNYCWTAAFEMRNVRLQTPGELKWSCFSFLPPTHYEIRADSGASLEKICLSESTFEERWHCLTFAVTGIFISPLCDISPFGDIVKRQKAEYFPLLRCEQLSGGPLGNEPNFNSQVFSSLCGCNEPKPVKKALGRNGSVVPLRKWVIRLGLCLSCFLWLCQCCFWQQILY